MNTTYGMSYSLHCVCYANQLKPFVYNELAWLRLIA